MSATFTELIRALIMWFDWGMGKNRLRGSCSPPQFRSSVTANERKIQRWVCVLPLDNANGVSFSGLLPTHQQQNNCKLSLGYQSNKVLFLILQTSLLSPVDSSGIFNLSVLITPMFCKSKRQGTALLNEIGQQGEESLYTKITNLNLDCTAVLHK